MDTEFYLTLKNGNKITELIIINEVGWGTVKFKGLFRRKGYRSKRANPSWIAKDSLGLQAEFHR